MGDDRNLDEQIGGVEEQIRSVEEDIRKLDQKISVVEEQIETCCDLQEKVQLRGKEAQFRDEKAHLQGNEAHLHDEKAHLQGKKAQLRGKEAQLREQILQGRGKCTEFGWLRQDLPSWNSGSCSKTPSTTRKKRMYTPVRVEYWDVVKDIEDYVNKADKLKRIYQEVDTLVVTKGKRNWRDIAGLVVASTCDFVSKKQSGFSVEYSREANLEVPPEPLAEGGNLTTPDGLRTEDRDVQKCFFHAKPPRVDLVVQSNGKNVAVFEVKNGGLGCPVPIHKLWSRCACRTVIDPNCWCNSNFAEGLARSILNCILQVYEYLILAKVGYGVLTDIQNWYLVRRDHTGCLDISVGFKWDAREPPLVAAIAYLVNSAVDLGEFHGLPRKGEPPWSWEATPCTSSIGGSKDDEHKDGTYKPNEHNTGGYKTSPARTREASSNTRQNQLQEIPASDLHLDDRPISCLGWSGCVVGGTLNGRRVAVKLAPRNSERAEALLNEVGTYLKLQEHWGVFVPPLVGYGTTADGQIVFIATELIDGSPLGPGTVTEEVATAALQALGAVHAYNLLHGDVEARNIMVVRGTQPTVLLVDFGFAQSSRNRKSQNAELRKLQRLLHDMMGFWIWKESGARHTHKQLCVV